MLFLSAPHLAGDDVRQRSEERRRYRFYPRHPRGWRRKLEYLQEQLDKFLSTPPSRVATTGAENSCLAHEFLSTPPSRVATSANIANWQKAGRFYPRHPRGWRRDALLVQSDYRCVSIHATLAGGDAADVIPRAKPLMFLSTPPSRVATIRIRQCLHRQEMFLSTPPSRVATGTASARRTSRRVSIHATLAGGDMGMAGRTGGTIMFLSTPPSRVATAEPAFTIRAADVSIHATLAGGDAGNFAFCCCHCEFLSTPPSRVATRIVLNPAHVAPDVSIHATLAGGD